MNVFEFESPMSTSVIYKVGTVFNIATTKTGRQSVRIVQSWGQNALTRGKLKKGAYVPWTWLHGRPGGYIMIQGIQGSLKLLSAASSHLGRHPGSFRQCQKLVQDRRFAQQIMSTPSESKPFKKKSSFLRLSTAKQDVENIPAGPLSGLVLPSYYGLQHSLFVSTSYIQYVFCVFFSFWNCRSNGSKFQKIHECSDFFSIWTWKCWFSSQYETCYIVNMIQWYSASQP